MEALIKTIPIVLRACGDSPEVAQAAAVIAWKEAAGETLRNLTVPLSLENKILTVAVSDTIWQRQLESMINQLIFRMNSILGQPLVKSLKFHLNPDLMPLRRQKQAAKADEESKSIPSELLSAAATIRDVQLRRAFLNAATSCL